MYFVDDINKFRVVNSNLHCEANRDKQTNQTVIL